MPFTSTQPALPWKGRSPIARHCSYQAAVSASTTRGAKTRRYLAWVQEQGQVTDWGAVDHFGWPMSTVNSVRNGLVNRGLVTAVGSCTGRYDRRVTIWQAR